MNSKHMRLSYTRVSSFHDVSNTLTTHDSSILSLYDAI